MRRYITTNSKWIIVPQTFEFDGLFKFGMNYIERLLETTFNSFWLNVLTSLKSLWKDNNIIIPDNIFLNPLWYNNTLRLQIKREWILKGICTINDLLESNGKMLNLEDFEKIFQLKSNFLEYGVVCRKIKSFLDLKEKPLLSHANPNNCLLNVILQKDTKGVSTLYRLLLSKNNSIIEKACNNWNEKVGYVTVTFEFRKSFSRINMFGDIYLRYMQFRTLHRRFFTNNILYNMRIKDSPLCDFCRKEEDSNEHMLIEYDKVRALWLEVQNWIFEIGVVVYSFNNNIIILGELQKSHWLNAIILITKKTIFNARTNSTCPRFEGVKRQVKNLYDYERHKYTLMEREDKFEKSWGMLLDYYDE